MSFVGSLIVVPVLGLALSWFLADLFAYIDFVDRYPVLRYRRDWGILQDFPEWVSLVRTEKPSFLDRFDWYLSPADRLVPSHQRVRDPRTVYVVSVVSQLRVLLDSLPQLDASHSDRVVLFAGEDAWLSVLFGMELAEGSWVAQHHLYHKWWKESRALGIKGLEDLALLRRYFSRIYFKAKDVHFDGVRTFPTAIVEMYMRGPLAASASAAISRARLDLKPRRALVAFGKVGPDGIWNNYPWDWERQALRNWSTAPGAVHMGVETTKFHPKDWWRELARSRFLLCPMGQAMQSAKMVEALLVLTLPILLRGPAGIPDDLVRLGFPLVVVDSWADVTDANLDLWWEQLAPRLHRFRKCLTPDAYWRLLLGEHSWCSRVT